MAHHGVYNPLSQTVDTDRRCRGCGYALRGLPKKGNCPECSMPILAPKWLHDPISRVPASEIRPRVIGAWTATVSALVMIASVIAGFSSLRWQVVLLSVFTVAAVGWTIGIFLLTRVSHLPQAAIHGLSPHGKLRRWMRALQPSFILAGGLGALVVAGVFTSRTTPLVLVAIAVCLLAGLAGIVIAAIVCEDIAEWVRDDTAQKVFGAIAFGLPCAVGLVIAGFFLLRHLAPVAVVIGALVAVASLVTFPYALLQLSRSLSYAVTHAEEHTDLEERRATQGRKDASASAARVRAGDRQKA